MLLLSVLTLVLFYFIHPAFFWAFLAMLVISGLYNLVQTAYSLDDEHGGICKACVLKEEDLYSDPARGPETTFYTVRLCYRDGTFRKVTLREDDAVLRNLRRRGMLCTA